MVPSKLILGGVLATQASAAILFTDLVQLYDRADTDISPGTPLYNCHDNCGQAILESGYDSSDILCSDSIFLTDYANCLACAGTDNEDIWQYYGSSLTSAAAECGLSTTPLAGTQATVGTADPAVSGGAATATTTAVAASSSSSSVIAVATSTTAAIESSTAVAATTAVTTTTSASVAISSAAVISNFNTTVTGAASGTAHTNSSSTTSSSLSVVTAGANSNQARAGLAGVVALGAAYAALY